MGEVQLHDIPHLRAGIDVARLRLSREEARLVSRVDGRTTVRHLAILCEGSANQTVRLVHRLVRARLLVLGEASPAELGPHEQIEFPPDVLAEPVELSDAEKLRILRTHAKLGANTPYQLLGVRPGDDAVAVKAAFRERCMEWHPDRFRRLYLGSYERRIEEIFRAVDGARRLLTDPQARAEYARVHSPPSDEEDINETLPKLREDDRQRELEERKRERARDRNPFFESFRKAEDMYEQALALRARGESIEALRLVQLAISYRQGRGREEVADDHRVDKVLATYAELRRALEIETIEQRIAPHLRRGGRSETLNQWDDAITEFSEAVRIAPDHGPAHLRLAYNLLAADRPPKEAYEHLVKARALIPDEPEVHVVQGVWYEKSGKTKAAAAAYQRALELQPDHVDAQKRLRKLRPWGF